jgi:hypothetical protein
LTEDQRQRRDEDQFSAPPRKAEEPDSHQLEPGLRAATSCHDRCRAIAQESHRLCHETEARSPEVVGGLSVALARAFKIIGGDLKNPATRHWQQCFRMFDLLI